MPPTRTRSQSVSSAPEVNSATDAPSQQLVVSDGRLLAGRDDDQWDGVARYGRSVLAEGWINLIGWRVFGIVSLVFLVLQSLPVPLMVTGLPNILFFSLAAAGIGGPQLAYTLLALLAGIGKAAETAQTNKRSRRR